MTNSEQPGSGGREDWRVRIASAVGGGAGAAFGLWGPFPKDLPLLWGTVAFVAVVVGGIVLGRLAGSLLFRRPPGK
jgi:hypothetical protein